MDKIFDGHLHTFLFKVPLRESIGLFQRQFDRFNVKKFTFLALPMDPVPGKRGVESTDNIDNLRVMYYKAAFTPNGYAYAGLEYDKLDLTDKKAVAEDLLRQVREFRKAGYDGIKMFEGHPNTRKTLGFALNDEVFDPFYEYCEKENFPIIIHVANAKYMWDKSQLSQYWIERGCAFDETYPSFDDLHQEVLGLLQKHPKLNYTVAHFGFMTYNKEVAEKFMSYENTKMDVTPGNNNYVNMDADREYWRDFIIKYSDKIVYGTDCYNFNFDNAVNFDRAIGNRPTLIKQFFETDKQIDLSANAISYKIKGFKIPKKYRKKIYFENNAKMHGEPNKIDFDYLIEKANEQLAKYTENDFEYYNLWCMTQDFETFKKGGKLYE
ncbi:MAG: amidohydrolase family protein [Clostridia bacterium]|nr:amidohydrolase family protein [Clostridia bacterium]